MFMTFVRLVLDEMHEEWRPYENESEFGNLVQRFEGALQSGGAGFFDVEEIEALLDHYMERRQHDKAGQVLKLGLRLHPVSLTLQLREAQYMAVTGQHVKAVPRLKRLLEFEPLNDEIHTALAGIYSQMQEHNLAIHHLKAALKTVDSEFRPDVLLDLAFEYEHLSDWRKAVRYLQLALEENPLNEGAVYELSFCFEQLGQFTDAVKYLEKFLDDQPYSFGAWYNLGNIQSQRGRYPDAIEAFDFALAIEDQFAPAYLQKAEVLMQLERYDDALVAYRESIAIEPEGAAPWCYLGECLEKLQRWDEAFHAYHEALSRDPLFADAHVGLGVLADQNEELHEALAHFQRAVELEPGHADFHLLLAATWAKLDDHPKAERAYLAAVQADPKLTDAWLERVDHLQRRDLHAEALAVIAEAIEASDNPMDLRYREFLSLHALRSDAQAFVLLEQLLTLHFDGAETLLNHFPALANDARFMERYERFKP